MGVIRRRAAVGLVAGVISSILLVATLDGAPLALLLGMIAGAGFAIVVLAAPASLIPSAQPSPLADALTGGVAGIPFWIIFSVFAAPIARGAGPQWQIDQLRLLFPHLVGWLLFGALLGVLVPRLSAAADYRFGRVTAPAPPPPETPTRIVILGGGFAGTTTAGYLEEFFGADLAVSFTLISDTNALLFTPMLAEVAASSLEASHISSPLRTSLRRTRVVRGRATAIDLDGRTVLVESGPGREVAEPYDHLVLALGAVSNYLGMTNVEAEAFDFKSLEDAIRIRNHVIEMFERADREPDAATRRAMLTFVVAGGGFAGAELAGGLNDFARGMLAYYPQVPTEDVQIVLVHSRDRILPELSDELAAYALDRMRARGVTFKLSTRVADARRGVVVLTPQDAPPEETPTETLIWTAGTRPNPLLETLPVERDRRGAVVVDGTLAVPGQTGLWALGDGAAAPNAAGGEMCPPTAQFALRQAKTLAHNLYAAQHGKPLKPFRFKAIGALCVVGHHTACAEVYGRRFSGLFAWLMWRGIYVGKLPGLERKLYVLSDWVIELFFPRDIVQTLSVTRERER